MDQKNWSGCFFPGSCLAAQRSAAAKQIQNGRTLHFLERMFSGDWFLEENREFGKS